MHDKSSVLLTCREPSRATLCDTAVAILGQVKQVLWLTNFDVCWVAVLDWGGVGDEEH